MKISKELQHGQTMKKGTGHLNNMGGKFEVSKNVRKMDNVQRLSGFKLLQDYSLTKHCYHVGALFMRFAIKYAIPFTMMDLDFVLKHDILETVTGDLLYTAKNYNSKTAEKWEEIEKELTDEWSEYHYLYMYTDNYAEKHMNREAFKLFKDCDLFELYEFCWTEVDLGNKSVMPVIKNCQSILQHSSIPAICNKVEDQWI